MRKGKKRSVLMALCVLLGWMSFVADGAHALFVSNAALTSNVITTGSSDILVSNSQNSTSTVFESTRPGFAISVTPGVPVDKYFLVRSVSPSGVDMDLDAHITTTTPPGLLSSSLLLSFVPVDSAGAEVGTPIVRSLESLTATHSPSFGLLLHNTTQRYKVSVLLDSAYKSQGDGITYDLILTGTQHLGS